MWGNVLLSSNFTCGVTDRFGGHYSLERNGLHIKKRIVEGKQYVCTDGVIDPVQYLQM